MSVLVDYCGEPRRRGELLTAPAFPRGPRQRGGPLRPPAAADVVGRMYQVLEVRFHS